MHPPKHVVEELERVHPQIRLGWLGREKRAKNELNPGSFFLLQLYHKRDAERSIRGEWNDAGPVFGSSYDRLMRVPMCVAELTTEDVFSGRVVHLLREWMGGITARLEKQREQFAKEENDYIRDLAGQAAQEALWSAKQTGATRPEPTPYKFLTKEDKAKMDGTEVTNDQFATRGGL